MKILLSICLCCLICVQGRSQNAVTVSGPDGKLKLNISVKTGIPVYSVTYKEKVMLEDSPLGLVTNEGDFSTNMELAESVTGKLDKEYTQEKIKRSHIKYTANTLKCTFKNATG